MTVFQRSNRTSANKAARERRKKASTVSKGEKRSEPSSSFVPSTRSNQVSLR